MSHIHSSQVVAFVVRDDVRQVGLLEVEEEALSIVANELLVAVRWGLEGSKMKRSCHASIHCDQLLCNTLQKFCEYLPSLALRIW